MRPHLQHYYIVTYHFLKIHFFNSSKLTLNSFEASLKVKSLKLLKVIALLIKYQSFQLIVPDAL